VSIARIHVEFRDERPREIFESKQSGCRLHCETREGWLVITDTYGDQVAYPSDLITGVRIEEFRRSW